MADCPSSPASTKQNPKTPPFAANSRQKWPASRYSCSIASLPYRKTIRPLPPYRLTRMPLTDASRRRLLIAGFVLAAGILTPDCRMVRAADGDGPLFAYVGTFSSPLHDVLSTQVDLPPGNGRGIHIFHVDRATGALAPAN